MNNRFNGPKNEESEAEGMPNILISYHLTANSSDTEILYPNNTWIVSCTSLYLYIIYANSKSYIYLDTGLSSELKLFYIIHLAY